MEEVVRFLSRRNVEPTSYLRRKNELTPQDLDALWFVWLVGKVKIPRKTPTQLLSNL